MPDMRSGELVAVSPEQIREAWRDLGRQLAEWRKAADLTQRQLAALTWNSRSSIANIETGRQRTVRQFWECADRELGADGLLIKAFQQAEELKQAYARSSTSRRARDRATDRPTVVVAVIVVGLGFGERFALGETTTGKGGGESDAPAVREAEQRD